MFVGASSGGFTVAAVADFVVLEECGEFGLLFFRSCSASSLLSWSSAVYFLCFMGLSISVAWFTGLQVCKLRLLLLQLVVVHRLALLSRLPKRWRIVVNRSYVPLLL